MFGATKIRWGRVYLPDLHRQRGELLLERDRLAGSDVAL